MAVEQVEVFPSKCGRPRKYDGQPCTNPAGFRTPHPGHGPCRYHGGTLPGVVAHSLHALAEQKARAALSSLGHPVDVDPVQALLWLVHEAAGNVAFLSGEMHRLQASNLLTSTDVQQKEQVKAIVQLYNEERDRLAKVSKMSLDAGLDARVVALSERQGEAIMFALRAIVRGLSLSPTQVKTAYALASDELRRLSGPKASDTIIDAVATDMKEAAK